jgi:2-dehydropantoate 2-reductase
MKKINSSTSTDSDKRLTALVIWYWWALWTLLSAVLLNNWIAVYGVWREKLKALKDTVYIEWKQYILPKKHYKIPTDKEFDMIIIATKTNDNSSILAEIKDKWIRSKQLILIQNWLLSEEELNQYKWYWIPFNTIAINWAYSFNQLSNEIVVHKSIIWWQIKDDKDWIKVAKLLTNSWIVTNPSKDIETQRASKLIINCLVSGLTSIFDMRIRELFHNHKTKSLLNELFNECYEVLSKTGKYNFPSYELQKDYVYTALEHRYWWHYSSMHVDVQRKRRTEIDKMN